MSCVRASQLSMRKFVKSVPQPINLLKSLSYSRFRIGNKGERELRKSISLATILLMCMATVLPIVLLAKPVKAPLLGDVDGNGVVDIRDLSEAAKAYGSYGPDGPNYQSPGTPASPNWDPAADLDGNNKVDILDLLIVIKNFGATV